MSLSIRSITYELPQPVRERVRLEFFQNEYRFRDHVRDHFTSACEPWGELLGAQMIEKARQILAQVEVSLVEEVYDRVVKVLDEGIESAITMPVFVAFRQRVDSGPREGHCFLAREGFYVVSHGQAVRSALFVGDTVSDSRSTRFRKAWQVVKKKYQGDYEDRKGGTQVALDAVTWVSQPNWDTCPVGPAPLEHPTAAGTLRDRLRRTLESGG
jgi:hypothetical protein